MRDIALFAFAFGLIPFILRHAFIGVLAWSWVSYMNPHRLTWGAAYDFPFAQMMALTLLVALLFNREAKRFPLNTLMVFWVVFLLWTTFTSWWAIYPDEAWSYHTQVLKIQLILFLALWMMGSEKRINLMVWVIFLSIGFFGIKGGIFTFLTGGGGRIFGPAGSFIADNNHLAVALLMIIPLGFYLSHYQLQKKSHKLLMIFGIVLITASVIGSFSRGAFLAIAAVGLYLWWKSPGKMLSGTLGVLILAGMIMMMPAYWTERMQTISTYEQDESAMGRLNSWQYSINLANQRFSGGGYLSWSRETFERWAPNPDDVKVAHSIYFAVLADHGWPGLLLFLMIFVQGWLIAGRISRAVRQHGTDQDQWIAGLAEMIKVSLVAYAVGGAFLSLAYFDLPWHLLALLVLIQAQAQQRGVMA